MWLWIKLLSITKIKPNRGTRGSRMGIPSHRGVHGYFVYSKTGFPNIDPDFTQYISEPWYTYISPNSHPPQQHMGMLSHRGVHGYFVCSKVGFPNIDPDFTQYISEPRHTYISPNSHPPHKLDQNKWLGVGKGVRGRQGALPIYLLIYAKLYAVILHIPG